MTWRDRIKVHPAAADFPMISDTELKELGEDIRKKGLDKPIVFYCEKPRPDLRHRDWDVVDRRKEKGELPLLDGRNRLEAMERAGLLDADRLLKELRRGKIIWANEFTPEEYVATANVHRRHLTPEWQRERRERIAALLKAHPEKSDRQIAKDAGVEDHKLVSRARAKGEAGGALPHVETRTDSKGRVQPAHKPRPALASEPAPPPMILKPGEERRDVMGKPIEDTGSKKRDVLAAALENLFPAPSTQPVSEQEKPPSASGPADVEPHLRKLVASKRPETISAISGLLAIDTGGALADIARCLGDAKPRLAAVPRQQRIAFVRGCQKACDLSDGDLRPIL